MDEGGKRFLQRTGYPRRRAVAACLPCRERKRKCDNLRPACSSCQKSGAHCEYIRQDASSFDAASLTILNRLSVIEDLLRGTGHFSSLNTSSQLASSSLQRKSTSLASVRPSENNKSSDTEPADFTSKLDASIRVATDKILQWPIFDKLLSPLPRFGFIDYHGSEAFTYLDDLRNQFNAPTPSSLSAPSRDISIVVNISTEKSDIERLIDLYFKRNNIKNPILNRSVVRQYCQQYYEHGPLFNLETCLVLLTCAIGALSTEFEPFDVGQPPVSPSRTSARLASLRLGHCYFVAAEKRLGAALSSVNALAVQCLCLAGSGIQGSPTLFHRLISCYQPRIYHMFSIKPIHALRMFHAAGASLQMLLSTGTDLTEGRPQITSSLFWICYKSEREILAEVPIGAPALREPATPDLYPMPPQAVDNDSEEWAATEEGSWYFLLSEIALRRITDQVSEVVAKHIDANVHLHQTPIIEELVPIVAEFERQAEAYREYLPPALKFPDVPDLASTEWQQYSRGRYYRVLELMHRPFLFTAIHDPSCSPTVLALAEKGLANALRYLQHSHTSHRHHGTWLHLRNQLKEASLLLAASKSSTLKMPDRWDTAITKTLQTFDYWSWEFPSCKTYTDVILTLSDSRLTTTNRNTLIGHI